MIQVNNFLKTLFLFLVIDITYLVLLRGSFINNYFSQFGGYHKYAIIYGLLAWVLLAFGIEYFVLNNNLSSSEAFIRGAILGLVIYGVYDFTNIATLKGWTLSFAIQDILWGMILCGIIAYLRS